MNSQSAENTPTQDNRSKYMILIAVGISSFMSALDGSITNTILPIIQQYFDSDIATIEWIVVVYLLILSGFLLTFGRLGDLHGHKKVFMSGFAVFVFSSVFCGIANSPYMLIGVRTLQALGGAMIAANSPAILTKNFPSNQRGQALGMQATMTYLGLVLGPALGGFLADLFSWRAVFYINVPVGAIAILLGNRFIPADSGRQEKAERFDIPGAFLFFAGLVALLLGLNRGHAWGWSSWPILSLLSISLILLTVFIHTERKISYPMLDLKLFRSRNFSLATTSAVMNYIAVYSVIFLMPFYLIQGRQFNPSQAGLLLTAEPLMMVIAAPLSGTLSDRFGTRVPSALGMFVKIIGLSLLTQLSPESPLPYVAAALAISGLGSGTFISPNSSALMGAAPRHRQGVASGVMATARSFGMVLGVGLSGAVLTTLMHEADPQALFHAVRIGFMTAIIPASIACLGAVLRQKDSENT